MRRFNNRSHILQVGFSDGQQTLRMTTVTTEGKSKSPQIGTEYSNDYVAELQKQGLSAKQVLK